MDLAVLIVGAIMGFAACYFTLGPGKDKMNKKEQAERTVKTPRKHGTARPRNSAPPQDED